MPQRRRGVRRRLRRGDGRRGAGDRRARRAGPGGDRAPPATALRSSPPGDAEALAAEIDALLRRAAPTLRELGARARAPPSSAHFTWEALRRARRSPPTRTRCGERRPSCFVTNHVPPDRVGAFAALHERVALELALFGGRSHHATAGVADPGVPLPPRRPARGPRASPRAGATARSSCGTGGPRRAARRLARRAPRARAVRAVERAVGAPAHAGAPRRRAAAAPLYRDADAVVDLRPARRRVRPRARRAQRPRRAAGGRQRVLARAGRPRRRRAPFTALFVGRDVPEKGLAVLLEAWRASAWRSPALVLVGAGPGRRRRPVRSRPPEQVAQLPTRRADVLVVPSLADPRLPRAVGAGRQRGHEPGTARHRHRRRRRRRRRARPPRAQRARRARRRPRARSPPRCARLHDDPALRARLGANAARATSPPTPSRPGPAGFAGALRSATVGGPLLASRPLRTGSPLRLPMRRAMRRC